MTDTAVSDSSDGEPFEPRASGRKSSAVSVPSQHTETPPPEGRSGKASTRPEDPWKDTRIFGTSMSGVSSKTVEWTLQEFPDGEANIIEYLENRADKLEELTNRVRQKPTDRAVRRLRDATEAARAILGRADKIRRQNRPGYRLVDPMAELLATIEEAETVLMPYITAKGAVIQEAVVEAATRAKEDLQYVAEPRGSPLVDLASTNGRHEGTGESRGLNKPGDTGKGGRPATHEPGREMDESIPAGDMGEESLVWDPFGYIGEDDLQVRFDALKRAGEAVPPVSQRQSTAIVSGKGGRGEDKGKSLPSIDQRPAEPDLAHGSDIAGTGTNDATGFVEPKSPVVLIILSRECLGDQR